MNVSTSNVSNEPTSGLEPDLLERLSREPGKRIDEVIAYFRRHKRPVELFEAMKMKSRLRHGLPMVSDPNESLEAQTGSDPAVQRAMEDDLLDACRQCGAMLIDMGKVGEAWMYLRPLADTALAKRMLSKVEITEANYDEMIHVLLHEGVDVARGYQAVIEHQGTCNSITLYDQAIAGRGRSDRQSAATCLLNHFYGELDSLVRQDFAGRSSQNGVAPSDAAADRENLSLGELVAKYQWILGGGGYHLDTTHLSSTVRFATVLDDPELIGKALQLCQYGRRLPADFQYPGEEPFKEFYPAHLAFFSALLGQNIDSAVRMFEQKARSVDVGLNGSGAIETYIDLLDRIGRPGDALRAAMELFPDEVPVGRVLPEMVSMAGRAIEKGDKDIAGDLEQFCFRRGDLLGVAAASELVSPPLR